MPWTTGKIYISFNSIGQIGPRFDIPAEEAESTNLCDSTFKGFSMYQKPILKYKQYHLHPKKVSAKAPSQQA